MEVERDVGLALSGGGYRAMLFHAGALTRLNEAGVLPRLRRVSSVSGGSIAAGVLAQRWDDLTFAGGVATNFRPVVLDRLLAFAGRGMDISALLGALLVPGRIAQRAARLLDKRLFDETTLGDLSEAGPEFIFASTNLKNGTLWYFSRARVGDYKSGFFTSLDTPLSTAVGASAAFPPFLSPAILRFPDREVRLSDGGVYDNLGLQPIENKAGIDYVLASDGGQPFDDTKVPPRDWIRGSIHVSFVVDYEVRKLRRSGLIDAFDAGEFHGTFWGIDTELLDYVRKRSKGFPLEAEDVLPVTAEKANELARVSTRLKRMAPPLQRSLVNWGYAVCDTALRKFVWQVPRGTFPFDGGV